MKNTSAIPLILLAAVALIAGCSFTEEARAGDLTFNVGATTDYVARGSTQSHHQPSYSVGAEYDFKGAYATVETENMDFADGAKQEIDLGAGYRTTFKGVNLEFGVASYNYRGDPGRGEDMEEAHVTASKTFGALTTTLNVAYSPNYFNMGTRSAWYEGRLAYAVSDKLSVSGGLGYQTIDRKAIFPAYATYNVGLTYNLLKDLSVDVRYTDSNLKSDRVGFFADPITAVSLTKTF